MTIEKLKKYGVSEKTMEAIQNIREIYNEKYFLLDTLKNLSNIEQTNLLMNLIYSSIIYIVRQESIIDDSDIIDELAFASETTIIVEKFLEEVIYILLTNKGVKKILKEKVPELYYSIYVMVDLQEEIKDELLEYFMHVTYIPGYTEIYNTINETIKYVIANAEILVEDVKKQKLYNKFAEERNRNFKYYKYREEF